MKRVVDAVHAAGGLDLIAVGRAILQDPNWVAKVREGRTADLMNFEASAMATLS